MAKVAYWLFKTEPSAYSFQALLKDGKTNWTGVRNYQARNFLKQTKLGDLVLIYHSVEQKAVVGIARVTKEGFPEPDPKRKGDWVQIEIVPVKALTQPVTLEQIKKDAQLKNLPLLKQSRLSVMPVSEKEFERVVNLSR